MILIYDCLFFYSAGWKVTHHNFYHVSSKLHKRKWNEWKPNGSQSFYDHRNSGSQKKKKNTAHRFSSIFCLVCENLVFSFIPLVWFIFFPYSTINLNDSFLALFDLWIQNWDWNRREIFFLCICVFVFFFFEVSSTLLTLNNLLRHQNFVVFL